MNIDKNIQTIFNEIYINKKWVNGSGSGSNKNILFNYLQYLENFIKEHKIKTIVDVGCGDWQHFSTIDLAGINYIGYDVSEYVISKNKRTYETDNIKFILYDGDFNKLPKADLVICKDVLMHLPNKDIKNFINILNNFNYALISNDISKDSNNSEAFSLENTQNGECHPIDLHHEPFNLDCKEVVRVKRPERFDIVTVLWEKNKEDFFCDSSRTINLLFCTDRYYTKHTCVCIESIIQNSKSNLNIYIAYFKSEKEYIKSDLEKYIQSFEQKTRSKIRINFVQKIFDDDLLIKRFVVPKETGKHITSTAYLRFVAQDLLDKEDKCLYLDGDIIVTRDLWDLYSTDISEVYLAGVLSPWFTESKEYKRNISISLNSPYINSGVLLMNLNEMRKKNVAQKFINQIGVLGNGKLQCCDQDIINYVCQKNMKLLPEEYNYFISNNLTTNHMRILPSIIHYNNVSKPWNSAILELSGQYWKYCKQTCFFGEILADFLDIQSQYKITIKDLIIFYIKSKLSFSKTKRAYFLRRWQIFSNKILIVWFVRRILKL